jgi:hypothetical protein
MKDSLSLNTESVKPQDAAGFLKKIQDFLRGLPRRASRRWNASRLGDGQLPVADQADSRGTLSSLLRGVPTAHDLIK